MDKSNTYVFWPYDLYPYLLGGIATKFKDEYAGRTHLAFVPTYGMWFKYTFSLPHKRGALFLKELTALRDAKRGEAKVLDNRYELERADLICKFNLQEVIEIREKALHG